MYRPYFSLCVFDKFRVQFSDRIRTEVSCIYDIMSYLGLTQNNLRICGITLFCSENELCLLAAVIYRKNISTSLLHI